MSWTCKWQGFQSIAPVEFGKICTETMVSLDLVILLVIFEVFAVVVAAWGWWIETKMKKVSAPGAVKLQSLEGGSV